MSHTKPENNQECNCPSSTSIPFLDTSTSILEDEILVDLFKKPTDRCQYLLPSSCHPAHMTENIPFSLAYRIVRICSSPTTRDKRLEELKEMLLSRDYKSPLVNLAIKKAKQIPRNVAIQRVRQSSSLPARYSEAQILLCFHSLLGQTIKYIKFCFFL